MKDILEVIALVIFIVFLWAIFGSKGVNITVNDKVYNFKIGTPEDKK